nr:MFS transporter [Streptomyces sp. SID5468]
MEDTGAEPLLPRRLLRAPGFPLSMLTVVVFFSGNAGLFLVLTYHLQSGIGLPPLAAGLVFVPLGAGFIAASAASRRLAARFGITTSVVGATVVAAGLALVPLATGHPPATQQWLLAAVMALSGLGQALVVAPLVETVLARVHTDDAGAGSGVLNTLTQAGMALGVAAIGTLYRTALGTNPDTPSPDTTTTDYTHAFNLTTLTLALLARTVAALCLRLRHTPARDTVSTSAVPSHPSAADPRKPPSA